MVGQIITRTGLPGNTSVLGCLAILAVAGVDCVVELAVAQLGHLGGQGGVGVGLRLQRGVDLGIVGVSFARFVP